MKQLILASTSKYRQELLKRLPLEFTAQAPVADEDSYKDKGLGPRKLAETLATLKATSLKGPNKVVIGSDQVAHFEGRILSKPGNREKAIEQITLMAGKTHELITSVCVCDGDDEILFTDVTSLTMRALSQHEIERYVDFDQPFDCAGSYKIEKAGITLMSKIHSEDFSAIQGLPLLKLSQVLRQKGFRLP
jgi:septum formation protein